MHKVTFSGSGFGASAELFLDGLAQTVASATNTEVVFDVSDLSSSVVAKVDFIAESGRPTDANSLLSAGLTFTPDLYKIESTTGSEGGSIIVLTAPGVGSATDVSTVQLRKTGGIELCSSIEIASYATLLCTMDAKAYSSEEFVLKIDSTSYSC